MDKTAGVVTALIIAPCAIVIVTALLRGYRFDIHFERDPDQGEGRGWFRRKPKDPTDPPKGDA
jgi:hypothetical protein